MNDAVAIAAFGLFIRILVGRVDPSAAMPGSPRWRVVVVFLHANSWAAWCWASSWRAPAMFMLPWLGRSVRPSRSITVALSYVSFVVADRYLHVSGRGLDGDVRRLTVRGLWAVPPAPASMVVTQAAVGDLGGFQVLGELPDLRAGSSMLAANVLLQITWLYFPLAVARRGDRRLPGARRGRVRHAAGAGEGQAREAG